MEFDIENEKVHYDILESNDFANKMRISILIQLPEIHLINNLKVFCSNDVCIESFEIEDSLLCSWQPALEYSSESQETIIKSEQLQFN